MANEKLDKAIKVLALLGRVLGPLALDVIREEKRLRELRDSGAEISDEEWAQADARFDAVCDELEILLGPETDETGPDEPAVEASEEAASDPTPAGST